MSVKPSQKVYQEVLEEIQKQIAKNQLKSGDRLPSEREMAEQMCTSRSSVREAFRALELLGLIEIRAGEGTFLKTYQPYQSVELLSSFILIDHDVRQDLSETKQLLEKEATKMVQGKIDELTRMELERLVDDSSLSTPELQYHFFHILFVRTKNKLLLKMWNLMEQFSQTMENNHYDLKFYKELLVLLKDSNPLELEALFAEQKTFGKINGN